MLFISSTAVIAVSRKWSQSVNIGVTAHGRNPNIAICQYSQTDPDDVVRGTADTVGVALVDVYGLN